MSGPLGIRFGMGVIKKEGDNVQYKGTMQFDDGEEVVVLSKSDLEQILKNGMVNLMMNRREMGAVFYDFHCQEGDCTTCTNIPDEIVYRTPNGDKKLFLDRHFYTLSPEKAIYARWISVEQADAEKESKVDSDK